MKYTSFFLLCCTLLLRASVSGAFDHVLLISIDTLRADHLGVYGSRKVATPNIDALGSNGVLFENTVAPAPFTLPSHTSMLTGLIPPVHGLLDNGGFYLNSQTATLASIFQSAGMKTGAFVSAFPLDSRFGLDRGFDVYDDRYPVVSNVNEFTMPERKAEETVTAALEWLRAQKASPWFAFVHLYDPHFPYQAPEPFRKQYPQDLYAAEVAYADAQVGRLMAFLKENRLEQKTLVVLTSDHGESLGEHKEQTHGIFAYESTLRVPMIFYPFQPKQVKDRVRLIDLAPTILALQKLAFPKPTQGATLDKYIRDAKHTAALQPSYFESLSMSLNAGWAPLRGFYSGTMKYMDLPLPELYDTGMDPEESKNLCSDTQLCTTWRTRFVSFFRPFEKAISTSREMDKETIEQLKALGYLSGSGMAAKETYGPQDDPKNLIVFHNRVHAALSFYNQGYDLKALEILEKIIAERPDYSVAYVHAGFIQNALGFPNKAIELLKQAIRNGLTSVEITGKLGVYLYEAGEYPEAIKQLTATLKQDPRDTGSLNYLGMTHAAVKDYNGAEAAFRKALEADPSDAMSHENLGTLYLTQKKTEMAAKSFEAALSINPHLAGAYNGLGVIEATNKNWTGAIRNWEKAVQENSQNYDAMLNLAFAYLENKQPQEAIRLLQEFEKNAPRAKYATDLRKVRALIKQLQ